MPDIHVGFCPNCNGKKPTKDHCDRSTAAGKRCRWRKCECGWTYDGATGNAYNRNLDPNSHPGDRLPRKDDKK